MPFLCGFLKVGDKSLGWSIKDKNRVHKVKLESGRMTSV
jgi:hypothetical protein